MAYENIVKSFPFMAENDLSATDNRFVKSGTTVNLVDLCGEGGQMIGIRRNSPAANRACEVILPGSIAKLVVGTAGVSKGDFIKSGSAGEAVTATDRTIHGAIALEAGTSGKIISVLVCIGYASI